MSLVVLGGQAGLRAEYEAIARNIPPEKLEHEMPTLSSAMHVREHQSRDAHNAYLANPAYTGQPFAWDAANFREVHAAVWAPTQS